MKELEVGLILFIGPVTLKELDLISNLRFTQLHIEPGWGHGLRIITRFSDIFERFEFILLIVPFEAIEQSFWNFAVLICVELSQKLTIEDWKEPVLAD